MYPGLMIADDHPVYRDAISTRVRQEFSPQIEVATAEDFDAAIDAIQASARGWVVLLDLQMPGMDSLDGVRCVRQLPNVRHVAAISGLDEKTWEPRVLAAGASVFISKASTSEVICRRLQPLLRAHCGTVATMRTDEAPDFHLTSRQQQVLSLVGEGYPNKIIADRLQITEQTVKLHVKQIFKELHVYNRTQAVLKAQKLQMI